MPGEISPLVTNCWYAAAWDREVGRVPLGRTICGRTIVLYRRLDGSAAALHDACPHRLAPLSAGMVEGDALRCRYHGMMFDGSGACVEAPGQARMPANFQVAAYPLVERYRFVWVWIGDPAKADPALLPDLWPCEHPDWTFDGGVYHLKADYLLMIDNLMDLTHETYVHAGSIGQPEIFDEPPKVTTRGDEVFVTRWMRGVDAPPFWRTALKKPGPVDRWQICRFLAPSTVMIDVGVAPATGEGREPDRTVGVNGMVIDFMTPAADGATWYFWGMARSFDIHDQGFTERFKAQQGVVFMEDVAMLEAQQRSLDANPHLKARTFDIDAGGALARRVIGRLASESASTTRTD